MIQSSRKLETEVGWLSGFYGISTFVVIQRQIHFYADNQFSF